MKKFFGPRSSLFILILLCTVFSVAGPILLSAQALDTYDGFITKWTGKPVDFDGVYPNQCMDLMHQYVNDVLGITNRSALSAPAAYQVFANFNTITGRDLFDKIDNTPTGVPSKGDIMFWGQSIGEWGHVAIFVEGDANSFRSFDANWPLGSLPHIQSHTYNGVLGWLRLKNAPAAPAKPASAPLSGAGSLSGVKIALDPGHGGQSGQSYNGLPGDPGAIGLKGLREADVVLAIGLKVRDLLAAQGATVYLTRDKDAFASLAARTSMANTLGVDRLVSIHENASSSRTPNYTGSHVYTTASQNSINLASKSVTELDGFHQSGVVSTNINVRGVHADNFHMVRESVMPAELVENSFISNEAEEVRLRTSAHLQASAEAIYRGIMGHLGKTVQEDASGPTIAHSAMAQGQEGAELGIAATITDASGVKDATLYYRRKGASLWISSAMTKGAGEIWSASVPGSAVTSSGVEYYVEARDAKNNLGRLPSGSPITPFAVTIAVLPKTGSLTGVITDLATGARLGGVAVALSPGGQTAYTGATGTYRFDNLAAGMYTATGSLAGYGANASARAVEAGSTWWNSFALSSQPKAPAAGDVVINELMWDAKEYIELYNRTNHDIAIAGWKITAGTGATADRVQVIIDPDAIIKAGGYYVASDAGALPGLTVDEIDAQTWAQTSQVVTVWNGSPLNASTVKIDQIGRAGGAWFAGINNTTGIAMERKSATASGTDAASWKTSNAFVGGRDGTADAANSAGRTVTAMLFEAGRAAWDRLDAAASEAPRLAFRSAGSPLSSLMVQALLAAGTYDSGPELRVAIDGPATVSAGSRHSYTATAYEGDRAITTQNFDVTFGNSATATVSRALTVTTSAKTLVTLTGKLDVAVDRQAGVVTSEINNPANGASDIEVSLASMIRSATTSVKIAVYAINSRLVIDALKEAADNLGAENVQIVMEGNNYASASYAPLAKELEAAGITIVRDNQSSGGSALMHHKFAVVDEQSVWVGSANMTNDDAYTNANNVLIFRSPELAAVYDEEFERMFAGQFGTNKTQPLSASVSIKPPSDLVDINKARASSLDRLPGFSAELAAAVVAERNRNGNFVVIEDLLRVPGMNAAIFNGVRSRLSVDAMSTITNVEVLFSPNGEIKQRIIDGIDGANTEIAFAIFTFTDPDIAAALERAKARGVRVRGVADAWQAIAAASQIAGLQTAGIDVKRDGGNGLMHNKFIVIDNAKVITGSVNWTNSAVNRNDESLLVISNAALARKYAVAFEGFYSSGK